MIEEGNTKPVENGSKKGTDKKIEVETFETKVQNDMVIEVEGKEGRKYRFVMPFNAPLPECHTAGINVLHKIKEIFDSILEQQKENEKKDVEEKK